LPRFARNDGYFSACFLLRIGISKRNKKGSFTKLNTKRLEKDKDLITTEKKRRRE
jgi:hypothetical protein